MIHSRIVNRESEKTLSSPNDYREKLVGLLKSDLDFHDEPSDYASHNFHSFPAKFPPQLPSKFIVGLTTVGDKVLDPMMGSGTTLLEAFLNGRRGIGFDIDPLARLLTRVKLSQFDLSELRRTNDLIHAKATGLVQNDPNTLSNRLKRHFDKKTREFVDYWFAGETQLELMALVEAIQQVCNRQTKPFFELVLSAIIITKSGGVSMAFDLGHTRPHRAKVVYNRDGEVILGEDMLDDPSPRVQFLTKTLRSPLEDWRQRFDKNLEGLKERPNGGIAPQISEGDAQAMNLEDSSVDLIITSPPYAANAIDYMRAHKFSLVWLGYDINDLSSKRKEYIGGQATSGFSFEEMPAHPAKIIRQVSQKDEKKGQELLRYYSEMKLVLCEMYRVLRPDSAAIVVVGNSTMRGIDSDTGRCLAVIGEEVGFEIAEIGIRNLDRDRRMMPAGKTSNQESQIQQRMHVEYVIGFYKPRAM